MFSLFDDLPADNAQSEGESLRDHALNRLHVRRPALVRHMMCAFLQYLRDYGADTSDALRALIEIPSGVDPRVTGAAVRGLAKQGLILSIGRRKSRRGVAHARQLDLWAIADDATACAWLSKQPDLNPLLAEEVVRG
jgi:hypothetical protein